MANLLRHVRWCSTTTYLHVTSRYTSRSIRRQLVLTRSRHRCMLNLVCFPTFNFLSPSVSRVNRHFRPYHMLLCRVTTLRRILRCVRSINRKPFVIEILISTRRYNVKNVLVLFRFLLRWNFAEIRKTIRIEFIGISTKRQYEPIMKTI